MAMRVKPDNGEMGLMEQYRVTNWSEYDRALVNRGNLTIKGLFQLPYRATEGLIKSLMRLCQLDLPVPDHTPMSRRAAQLSVKIPRRPRKGPTHVVVDSTGLKIFGEGEWAEAGLREASLRAAGAGRLCKADCGTVRQHGVGKRRTWRKVHLAVDATTKDIIGIEVTTTAWGDSEILPSLLDQVEGEITQISADGAYDSHGCHAAIAERDARATTRPAMERFRGETTTPATPSSRKSKPRDLPAGRTTAATTGAASPRT